jgi:hypothetical protein
MRREYESTMEQAAEVDNAMSQGFDDDANQSRRREFVGRERELAELCAGLDDACGGRGRLFLVTGEPGIGKTWLAEEVARRAASRAIGVLRAGCWDGDGAPHYWPFIQIMRGARGYLEPLRPAPAAPAASAALAGDIAELIDALQRSGADPDAASADAEQARFRLFDWTARLIRELAASRPLMLLFEDLHQADQPSLQMLRLVASQLKHAPVLVLCTYRDAAMRHSAALAQLLGFLMHDGVQVPLFGLSRDETARLIEQRAGTLPNPRLVAELHQAAAGNPLFIDGLVRALAADGDLRSASRLKLAALRVPDGVRATIARWLAPLPGHEALVIAATIGAQFELRCLQRVTRIPPHQLLDLMREACAGRILTPLAPGAYRFTHALIRGALADELDSAQRAAVHVRIAQALEELYGPQPPAHLDADLAGHFAAGGEFDKAIAYSIRAGDAAGARLDDEAAASHWEKALDLMAERPDERERRAELTEKIAGAPGWPGTAQARLSYLERALKLYQELERPVDVARVQARIAIVAFGPDVRLEPEAGAGRRIAAPAGRLGEQVRIARAEGWPSPLAPSAGDLAGGYGGIFRKEGEYWTVAWVGSEARLKHRKGMTYIAWLLRHPGREFAAAELTAAVEPAIDPGAAARAYTRRSLTTPGTIAIGLGDAGAILDATAKAQYHDRLADLRDELDLAERHNDPGRASRMRGEIEFIEAQLAAAVGLRGRDRKAASHAERARLAVTKAIKAALHRIRHADPELGRHLGVSIQTGHFCAYRPPRPVDWHL